MGLLNSEFKRAYEEAKVYGTETDQLRIKHDYLSQKSNSRNAKWKRHRRPMIKQS